MPGDTGPGIIIIRRKLNEQAFTVAPSVKVWHVLAAIALISFIAGAVIF
jgi:hypothetical protein